MKTCSVCASSNPDEAKFCFKCGATLSASTAVAGQAPNLAFLTLGCPSCGSSLKVDTLQQYAQCPNCGTTHLVLSGGGIVTLQAVQQVGASAAQLYQTTSQIEQNVAGMGSDFQNQSVAFQQQSVTAGLTQELINARKELSKYKNNLRAHPSGWFFLLPIGVGIYSVFFTIIPAINSGTAEDFWIPVWIGLGVLLLIALIINKSSREKLKKKIAPLEQRVNQLEQMLRDQGGQHG